MPVELDTTPYWIDSAAMPRYPKLDRDLRADVVVVGAGITGLTAAYLLADAGRSVIVVERRRAVVVDTAHTTAHLTMVTDLVMTDLVKQFGRDHAQAVWDAGLAAIAQIESIVDVEQIDCGFARVPGYLHAAPGRAEQDADWLREEAHLVSDLGFDASFVDAAPVAKTPCVMFDNQARFHPRQYLAGVARAFVERGGRIFEHSEAAEFSTEPFGVKAGGHQVTCDRVVLATHTPLMGRDAMLSATLFQTKLALYSSYAVAAKVPPGSVPDVLLWDTADPYHYLRVAPAGDSDLVIYGGEDHKTGQSDDTTACFARLEEALQSLVPGARSAYRWSGQVIETHDGLPYIGETADRQFAGTGYSGNGMTFGTIAAMMACDWIVGQQNPWSGLFDPARKNVRAGAWDYVKENKDYPYYLVRDRFAGTEAKSLRAVPRGEGRIVEYHGQKAAACRSDNGTLTVRSAVCTHMGCLVAWNAAERTWDCPCHGSRFEPAGRVLAGPAETPLQKLE